MPTRTKTETKMEKGIYKALKRLPELYDPRMFTNNLQIWLSMSALSLFITIELYQCIHEWWTKMIELSPLGWIAYIIGSIVVLFFGIMGLWALISIIVLSFRGMKGVEMDYDPKTIPPEMMKVMEQPKKSKSHVKTNGKPRSEMTDIVGLVIASIIGIAIIHKVLSKKDATKKTKKNS